jgi:hypothetical protein
MWTGLLKAGEARSKKTITFNIIGCMGAARWYQAQLASGEAPLTKKGKRRIRVASSVLDRLVKEMMSQDGGPAKRRKLGSGGIEPSTDLTASVSSPVAYKMKRLVINKIAQGRRFDTMASEAGFGILLLSNIW